MFATGIENCNSTVGNVRVDELARCRYYAHWRKEFDCVQKVGIQFLRYYGPPIHTIWLGVDQNELVKIPSAMGRRGGMVPAFS